MTEATVVQAKSYDSTIAGKALALQIAENLSHTPDVVILFISPVYDHAELLQAFRSSCATKFVIGCSSAGEFPHEGGQEGLACAVALYAENMKFSLGVGRSLREDPQRAARELAATFQGNQNPQYYYRSAIIFIDGLSVVTERFLEELTLQTKGAYQFFGAGAGDNAAFRHTPVFYGNEVLSDAVVALEILSNKPIGIGTRHDWIPVTDPMHVTEVKDSTLISIDGKPAIEAFRQHAYKTEQFFDESNPAPFFFKNLIGIDMGTSYKLRVPLRINPDGSIFCASEFPPNATIRMMNITSSELIKSAERATLNASQKLYGSKPAVTLYFDCPVARYRMGDEYREVLHAIRSTIGDADSAYIACNVHGQLIRTEGQYGDFFNCTSAICMIPE